MSTLVSVHFVCDSPNDAEYCEVQYLFMPLLRVTVDDGAEALREAHANPALPRGTFAECMWESLVRK